MHRLIIQITVYLSIDFAQVRPLQVARARVGGARREVRRLGQGAHRKGRLYPERGTVSIDVGIL